MLVPHFFGTSIVKKNICLFQFINNSPLAYRVNVKELIEKLGTVYNPLDWFIGMACRVCHHKNL